MLKKPLALTLGLSLLALAACTNGHKLEVRKTLKTGKAGSANTQNKDVNDIIAGSTNCLPLYSLMKQLTEKNSGTAFTAYIQSRSLSNAGAYVDDAKLNLGLLSSLSKISETTFGSELKSSAVIGDLLRVSESSDCDSVTFLNADGTPKQDGVFTVVKGINPGQKQTRDAKGNITSVPQAGSPGLTKLKSKSGNSPNEYEYRVIGDNLVIDAYEPFKGDACDKSAPTIGVRTRYVMSLSGSESNLVLGPRFAKLLVDTLLRVPAQLDKTVKALRDSEAKAATDKKVQTTRGQSDGMRDGAIVTDLSDLIAIGEEIKAKHFKEISCK